MPSDRTQHQSADQLKRAGELSLESTRPPAQIPGYRLEQFIGSGAFGEVWSAKDLKTGRRVAVKFYTRRSHEDVQLLAQEVQKLVVLSNDSYVVGLLDVGWDANPPYYVMDYIESGSLEDRLKHGQAMPTSEAIELFKEIATGMMFLHGKGILHCDLKPGNVLLDQNGKPRVADFGQSRLSTDETPALGTLFYMAPEQADMAAIPDAGWDVYGLGALLFSMLTGQPPFYSPELAITIESSDDIGDRLSKYRQTLLASPPPQEHRQVPGVDRSLGDIIDKCIAADPKRRFTNVQSVLLALRERELARTRRPLMLLGLIAPFLLMAVVAFFGWKAFGKATSQTEVAVTFKAQESNDYAAKLAARSAAEQVAEYFRAVRQLAGDQEFKDLFDEIIADEELKQLRIQLADPMLNPSNQKQPNLEAEEIREAFKAHELRERMQQQFLKTRMLDRDNEYPVAASWFVSDRYGNQIASEFDVSELEDDTNRTLGCNYAYRTYFTGLDDDLEFNHPLISHTPQNHESLITRPIITEPHLSAVFQSKQSKTWKVAFSAPIIRYGQVEGIVAVTVNLGNLIEFENSDTQYVMLIDNRTPTSAGAIILQHPLFTEVLNAQEEQFRLEKTDPATNEKHTPMLPAEFANTPVDLSEDKFPFEDPLGKTELGRMKGYDRESIMSREPVSAQIHATGGEIAGPVDTGLEVVAVQDFENVLADVNRLATELGRLAALAGLVAIGLVLGMLLFVNRMMRESRERLGRAFLPKLDNTAANTIETIGQDPGPNRATHVAATHGPAAATDRTNDQ